MSVQNEGNLKIIVFSQTCVGLGVLSGPPLFLFLHVFNGHLILVPRAHDPSGLRQESRGLGATISGMRHRCRLRETGWAEFGYFLCYFKMVAPRALVFRPLVKGNEALGTRLQTPLLKRTKTLYFYGQGQHCVTSLKTTAKETSIKRTLQRECMIWGLTRPKQLSMAATVRLIWLCACVRYWPDRGLVFECVTCFLLLFLWFFCPSISR